MELSPAYAASPKDRRTYGATLYAVAAEHTDRVFRQLLAAPVKAGRNTVVFMAGGAASGKSSAVAVDQAPGDAEMVFDTTFSNSERAMAQVKMALDHGRQVQITYVHRDFEGAVRGMLGRAVSKGSGRVVNVGVMAHTHRGARDSILRVLEAYSEDRRVSFDFWKFCDGAVERISIREFLTLSVGGVDTLRQTGENILDGISYGNHERWDGGEVPRSILDAARSRPG